jgi:hypothetical protein
MNQSDAWRIIRRRDVAAGIHAPIGNHTFRATAYLRRHARKSGADGEPRLDTHDATTAAPRK